jgi:large subunit ribosomal protein L23
MAIVPKSGVVLESYQVILKPLITEKGTYLSSKRNAYTFQVNPLATKFDIKKAVEELFSVKVEKVRTQNRVGKPRRHRMKLGYTSAWKKAIVTLNSDDRIAFF